MKRKMALVLAAVLVCVLAACGGTTFAKSGAVGNTPASSTAAESGCC